MCVACVFVLLTRSTRPRRAADKCVCVCVWWQGVRLPHQRLAVFLGVCSRHLANGCDPMGSHCTLRVTCGGGRGCWCSLLLAGTQSRATEAGPGPGAWTPGPFELSQGPVPFGALELDRLAGLPRSRAQVGSGLGGFFVGLGPVGWGGRPGPFRVFIAISLHFSGCSESRCIPFKLLAWGPCPPPLRPVWGRRGVN